LNVSDIGRDAAVRLDTGSRSSRLRSATGSPLITAVFVQSRAVSVEKTTSAELVVVSVYAADPPEAVAGDLLLHGGGHFADAVIAFGRQRRVDEPAVGGPHLPSITSEVGVPCGVMTR
jgi:hypothetical protein